MEKISVVVPCYNESTLLRETLKELKKVLDDIAISENYMYEIIFVDDGSEDNTLAVIKELSHDDDAIKYISFSRNFGKNQPCWQG